MKNFAIAVLMVSDEFGRLSYGQTIDANLVGTVVDASGAAVPNANVEIQHLSTGVKTGTKTNVDGQYRLNNIPIGLYNVTATASGFATATLKNVDIQLSKTSTANITLQVGSVATTVDVADIGAVIDTTTSQLQSNFESRQIVNLPIIENANGLFGALNLSLLSAGVSSNGGVGQGTGPSVGGQRPMNNNFMIEGVDNNNKTVTGPLVYVPTEATAEFTPPAESGRRRVRPLLGRPVQYRDQERHQRNARFAVRILSEPQSERGGCAFTPTRASAAIRVSTRTASAHRSAAR